MKISDNTAISMPMRNLLSILGATAVGVWAYFGVIERLNNIETQGKLMIVDVEKKMGTLPADAQQDMLIEFMSAQVEAMQEEMEGMMSNTVNIKRAQQDIEKLILDTEKLEDKVRANGSH